MEQYFPINKNLWLVARAIAPPILPRSHIFHTEFSGQKQMITEEKNEFSHYLCSGISISDKKDGQKVGRSKFSIYFDLRKYN